MERVEAAAKAAGAIGGKACGAGAGGCMLFVVRRDAAEAVRTAVQDVGGRLMSVAFDFQGVRKESAD
jgi:D-glycero-alpha-D-manno-heptose-7-phosphate kinase